MNDYASELVAHPSLWQVGLLYLENSGSSRGKAMVEVVLQRLPLTDDSKARKVMQVAADKNLDHVGKVSLKLLERKYTKDFN